jgi:hypothetical protein
MTLDQIQRAAEIARSRTNDKRWLAAIDKAVAGIVSGWWIVTELANCLAVTTETGKTYFANGVCQCEAYRQSQACKHRALYRLYEIARELPEETATPAVSDAEIVADVAESPRENLIAEITNIWPRFAPGVPLDTELLARFKVNRLDMLDDGALRDIRLAIAL